MAKRRVVKGPKGERRVKLVQGAGNSPNFCFGLQDARTGADVLFVQTDWDYPGLASRFGWSVSQVQKCEPRADFDFLAECGVLHCVDCRRPYYPMEVEEEDACPDCGGPCRPLKACPHDATDGTVDCKACGVKAGDFLAAAYDHLAAHDGEVIRCDDYNPETFRH